MKVPRPRYVMVTLAAVLIAGCAATPGATATVSPLSPLVSLSPPAPSAAVEQKAPLALSQSSLSTPGATSLPAVKK